MKELFNQITKGDRDALEFCMMIDFVVDTWDDLVDHDQMIEDARINSAFWTVLIEMPRNSFYREHFDKLNTLIAIAIQNWEAATKREREGRADEVSFVLRSSFIDIYVMVALIIGGRWHAEHIASVLREGAHAEGMTGYKAALEAERQAREGR